MYSTLLTVGLATEVCKAKADKYSTLAVIRVSEALNAWDEQHYKTEPCDGTILCERTKYRHKADCLGKTEKFQVYARALI